MYCAYATITGAKLPMANTAIKDAAKSIFVFIQFTCSLYRYCTYLTFILNLKIQRSCARSGISNV
ncbi:Hypothetical protein Nlim_1899 [Candidatus Nitrosarchaeum limnium SFB1]|uniref:Uncharacterized protein n=1 Tax=Candidatus Nitrosarchaeum limnium SFB1 TaxID=886738 RepID=F3KNB8_9ARCH|nr:Hypothetical protein Nlim_1899 [Candidatus Nitrosarchaeum limnium SFB1]